jgi:inhibitor of cysteine peptidase
MNKMNGMNKKILLLGSYLLLMMLMIGCSTLEPIFDFAIVEEIDIIILESFPVQVYLVASGYLPDPCTKIYQISREREDYHFSVSITTFRSPGACIQIIAPFEETIPLEVYGLPAGTYTVNVNGVQGTFSLEVDNILPI